MHSQASLWSLVGSRSNLWLCATSVQVILAMDDALASDRKIGLQVDRDKGDSTSLMTLASPSGQPLRPDGVMRALDGLRMLAKVRGHAALATPVCCFLLHKHAQVMIYGAPSPLWGTTPTLCCCAQWEDKGDGHSIHDAMVDLQAKTAAWTPLYYGTAQVRFSHAASHDSWP